jgi:hypothetical protein
MKTVQPGVGLRQHGVTLLQKHGSKVAHPLNSLKSPFTYLLRGFNNSCDAYLW